MDATTQGSTTGSWARLAEFVIAAQTFMLLAAWLLPSVSSFSLTGDTISELALGPWGFVQSVAFLAGGLSIIALGYALAKTARPSWMQRLGVGLVLVWGVGVALLCFFPTDRVDGPIDWATLSATGMTHIVLSLIAYPSALVAIFLLTWVFAGDAAWRPVAVWSGLFFSAALPLFFSQQQGEWAGLMSRLLASAVILWTIVVALRLRHGVRR